MDAKKLQEIVQSAVALAGAEPQLSHSQLNGLLPPDIGSASDIEAILNALAEEGVVVVGDELSGD